MLLQFFFGIKRLSTGLTVRAFTVVFFLVVMAVIVAMLMVMSVVVFFAHT